MTTRGDKAKENFLKGYNCAQSVMLAFSDMIGLDDNEAAMLASGFGGGVGRMREICGAVSSMTMIAGILHGYSSPVDDSEKARSYEMIQKLAAQFKDHTGSIICKELLGLESAEGTHIPEKRTEEYYKNRPCAEFVKIAGDILEEYLADYKGNKSQN